MVPHFPRKFGIVTVIFAASERFVSEAASRQTVKQRLTLRRTNNEDREDRNATREDPADEAGMELKEFRKPTIRVWRTAGGNLMFQDTAQDGELLWTSEVAHVTFDRRKSPSKPGRAQCGDPDQGVTVEFQPGSTTGWALQQLNSEPVMTKRGLTLQRRRLKLGEMDKDSQIALKEFKFARLFSKKTTACTASNQL